MMNRKRKKTIYRVLFMLAASLFLISGNLFLSYMMEYQEADDEYRQVAEGAIKIRQNTGGSPAKETAAAAEDEAGEAEDENADASGGEHVPTPEEMDPNPPALIVDFDILTGTNGDVVAWIDFPGQDISYPVVQGEDNDRYLHYTFSGSSSASGSIFLDCRNDGLMRDGNTIIYGHNMKNGSMFGSLKKYQDQAYFEQYPYFDVYTREGVYRCGIIAAGRVRPYEESYQILFADEGDRADYISLVKQMQYYEMPGVESSASVPVAAYVKVTAAEYTAGQADTALVPLPDASDAGAEPLVLLSTCTGGSHAYRFVLLAQVEKFFPEE